jgi:hypothetical protein
LGQGGSLQPWPLSPLPSLDTNVLVYRFDGGFPGKQKKATEILRRAIVEDSVRLAASGDP